MSIKKWYRYCHFLEVRCESTISPLEWTASEATNFLPACCRCQLSRCLLQRGLELGSSLDICGSSWFSHSLKQGKGMGCHLRSTSLGHGRLLLPKGYLLASKNLLGWSRLRSSRCRFSGRGLGRCSLGGGRRSASSRRSPEFPGQWSSRSRGGSCFGFGYRSGRLDSPSQHGTDKVRPRKNSTSFVVNVPFFGGSLTRPKGPVWYSG